MIHAQNLAFQQVIDPVANSGVTAAEAIDTQGYNYLTVIVGSGNIASALTALKLTESDSSGSGYADITGANADGGTDIDGVSTALPSASDDDKMFIFEVDLRTRKRYIKPVVTGGGSSNGVFCLAIASRANEAQGTAASRALSGTAADIDAIIRI